MRKSFILGLLSLVMVFAGATAHAQAQEEARLLNAQQVIKNLGETPDQFIPQALLERAYGIAVVPDLTKGAFFFGASRGNGVLIVRNKYGRFSDPIFINVTGGSFGLQWGIQSTNVVLVFTTASSIRKITSGKITLGADASVAAGPIGRQASAATDPTFHSQVYSYSRSKGLFLGIALKGSVITIDKSGNARFYNRGTASAAAIAGGTITTNNPIAHQFLAEVYRATGAPQTAAAAVAPPASATPGEGSQNTGSTRGTEGAQGSQGSQTFPLGGQSSGGTPAAN